MGLFDPFRAALTAKAPPTIAELEKLVAQARTAALEANTTVERLEAEDDDLLLAPDAERARHRKDVLAARDTAQDALRFLGRLQQKLADARDAEAEATAQAMVADARAKSDAAAAWIKTKYPKLANEIRAGLKHLLEAHVAVEAANAALPDGWERLPDPEAFRSTAYIPPKVVKEQVVELWCLEGHGSPLPEPYQSEVKVSANGHGLRTTPGPMSQQLVCVRRRFTRTETLARALGVSADPLSHTISLPGVGAGEPAIVRPSDGSRSAQRALCDLAESDRSPAPSSAEREVEVTYTPVSTARLEAA